MNANACRTLVIAVFLCSFVLMFTSVAVEFFTDFGADLVNGVITSGASALGLSDGSLQGPVWDLGSFAERYPL